jgi:hypothetical protein
VDVHEQPGIEEVLARLVQERSRAEKAAEREQLAAKRARDSREDAALAPGERVRRRYETERQAHERAVAAQSAARDLHLRAIELQREHLEHIRAGAAVRRSSVGADRRSPVPPGTPAQGSKLE